MPKTRTDKLVAQTLTTSLATHYTVPASTSFVLNGIMVTNYDATDKKVEVVVAGKKFTPYVVAIPTGEKVSDTNCGIVLPAGTTIQARGESTSMDIFIWGIEEV